MNKKAGITPKKAPYLGSLPPVPTPKVLSQSPPDPKVPLPAALENGYFSHITNSEVPSVSKPVVSPPPSQTAPPEASSITTGDSNPSQSSTTQPDTIRSNMPLSDWRGSIATFRGFTGTLPARELKDAGWEEISGLLCPAKPAILADKKTGQYVVPCPLKEAPLVGNTLETAKKNGASTVGKMRSKDHVTEAAFVMMDVDGLPETEFTVGREKLEADGVAYFSYTSHSQGRPDKPGMRARLAIPIDRAIGIDEYAAVWKGIDNLYFSGAAGKADSSGKNLYQQQGTWCCHPDRVDQAKSWRFDGGVASADVLVNLGGGVEPLKPAKPSCKSTPAPAVSTYPPADANKIADKCQQIRKFRDTKGADQNEPHWFDCIGAVCHCVDGEAFCQDWSSGYFGYDEAVTANKIAHRIKFPPTTCTQFRKINPEDCEGCTLTCNSPISLGYAPMEPLAAMQQQFGMVNIGKICVFDREALAAFNDKGVANKLQLLNRSDGKLMIERALREHYPKIGAGPIIKEFWVDPKTPCYHGIEFNPKGTSRNFLNLWVAPTIIPMPGVWFLIKAFLLEVICDGDQAAYDYLIRFIAHALQHPEEKPGVMIILIGGQGIGKGTMGRLFQRIWSATCVQLHEINAVTGNFNASLERAFIVILDEALFVGNRRASDALKSLVTEPIIYVNEKNIPARQMRSYHRFIASTNADHFKHTERDDRRDFTLRVSESRKDDFDYWNALNYEIDHGGVEAMAHDLLAMDLSDFNVRKKPNTKEFLEQKLLSLDHMARWWRDCLQNASIDDGGKWPEFISTNDIIDEVTEFSGGKTFHKPTAISVAQEMKKLCPSAISKQKQLQHSRSRGFALPPLKQARIEFDRYIGGDVSWPEEGDLHC